ncbi:LLM class flavin-dependent oxidoreductase [Desertihabitans brevis]|uniref:LLM class flavin-dependent oxidoreductase n=1 Tax=Desertihabitans brevis TaxID=2268447 RepID=A0A367YWB8_9ACTN|nr:LLM class flavin-dependent oxidoreductase [Desertihabitans brevis]RCK69809.1 LLM class flavin-dependent oxidoreductase [Desertihabitans brevis]
MRFGIVILPELPWREAGPRWREAEELGFDSAWTYDHLSWGGLPDVPWYGTVPTLTAAAMVTRRIRLGTFVVSPNYRHPASFVRELLSLHDVSEGRLLLGLGAGGTPDDRVLGTPPLSPRQKVDRLAEFTALLRRLLGEDHVDHQGEWFTAVDARSNPGEAADLPLVVAGNGPRSLRLAVQHGSTSPDGGWVTTGGRADDQEGWWRSLAELSARLDEQCARTGATLRRYLSVDSGHRYALQSASAFAECVERAAALGFTDVVTHWPRPEPPYVGTRDTLEEVAALLPQWRGL